MLGFSCKRCDLVLVILLTIPGASYADTLSDMATTLRADFASPEIPATEALIDQSSGDANIATIDQSATSAGGRNYAEINQNGSSNQASVIQTGDSNRARIDQTGSSNWADVTQSGSGNSIDLAQTGDANLFVVKQIGDNNLIVATQNGASATLDEIGNNNSITAMSPAAPNVSISIVGNGMTVTAH